MRKEKWKAIFIIIQDLLEKICVDRHWEKLQMPVDHSC